MTVLLPFFSDIETNAADLDVATVERRQKTRLGDFKAFEQHPFQAIIRICFPKKS